MLGAGDDGGVGRGGGGGRSFQDAQSGRASSRRPLSMFPCAITSFKRFASKHFSFIIYSVDRCLFGV